MAQRRRGGDLAQEPVSANGVRQLRAQHFHRHVTPVLQVVRAIHQRHAAGADLGVEAIAVSEGGAEPVRYRDHRRN